MNDLKERLKTVKIALDRMGYHMEGIEPYHPCIDRSMNWWCAASTEIDDILEELEKNT